MCEPRFGGVYALYGGSFLFDKPVAIYKFVQRQKVPRQNSPDHGKFTNHIMQSENINIQVEQHIANYGIKDNKQNVFDELFMRTVGVFERKLLVAKEVESKDEWKFCNISPQVVQAKAVDKQPIQPVI